MREDYPEIDIISVPPNGVSLVILSKQRRSGCCGSEDTVFEFTDQESGQVKIFHYGYNYGH